MKKMDNMSEQVRNFSMDVFILEIRNMGSKNNIFSEFISTLGTVKEGFSELEGGSINYKNKIGCICKWT